MRMRAERTAVRTWDSASHSPKVLEVPSQPRRENLEQNRQKRNGIRVDDGTTRGQAEAGNEADGQAPGGVAEERKPEIMPCRVAIEQPRNVGGGSRIEDPYTKMKNASPPKAAKPMVSAGGSRNSLS